MSLYPFTQPIIWVLLSAFALIGIYFGFSVLGISPNNLNFVSEFKRRSRTTVIQMNLIMIVGILLQQNRTKFLLFALFYIALINTSIFLGAFLKWNSINKIPKSQL